MIGVFGATDERVDEVLAALKCECRLGGALYSVCRTAEGTLVLAVSCTALGEPAVLATLPRARAALYATDEASAEDTLVQLQELLQQGANASIAIVSNKIKSAVSGHRVFSCEQVADAVHALLSSSETNTELPPTVVFERVVNAGGATGRVTVLGRRAEDGSAVLVTVGVGALTEDVLQRVVEAPVTAFTASTCVQRNGKYAQYAATLTERMGCTLDVVAPASAADIAKAQAPRMVVVAETPALYAAAVAPAIARIPACETQWISNIIDAPPAGNEGRATVGEEVLFENEHAVLLRDTKWPAASTDVRELYCLLIVKRAHAHLRSVRDLRGPDAPWLAATVRACEAHIQQRFGVAPARVRAFFHYPPSFYHLHVHFVHVDSPANGPSTYAGRALLVADVLQNLRLDPDYYRHATLTICAAEKTLAVSALINAGAVSHPLGAGAGDDDEVQKN